MKNIFKQKRVSKRNPLIAGQDENVKDKKLWDCLGKLAAMIKNHCEELRLFGQRPIEVKVDHMALLNGEPRKEVHRDWPRRSADP